MNIKDITRTEVLKALEFCVLEFGISKYKKEIPRIHFMTKNKMASDPIAKGYYEPTKNLIVIFKCAHNSCVDLFDTMVHEYTHYCQDMSEYSRLCRSYSYDNHPYEIEAWAKGEEYKWFCKDYVRGI
jgi:Zn-dependent peptidase ImmA (M78 family)